MQPNVSNVNLFVCEKILTEGDIFSAIRIADLFVTTINSDIPIGSQVPSPTATLAALEVALEFVSQVKDIESLDLGGGFPVAYRDDGRAID